VKLEFGSLNLRRKKFKESKEIAEELIFVDQNNVRAMNLLSRALMLEGNFSKAQTVLERANVLSPANAERLLLLGDAFYKGGDLDKALESYEQARNIAASELTGAEAAKRIGSVKIEQGQVEQALEILTKCVSEDETASFFNNAAVQAARSGKIERALGLYNIALMGLKTDHLKAIILCNLAIAYRKQGDFQTAFKCVEEALKFDKNHSNSIRQMRAIKKVRAA
jgi:tetratricopeptide (TPR) repeat protein